ncbi:MAG: hypothetical protein IPJ40_22320 [Saprospirales bacterium]|nr:hypothetical protein [Saprospirales bacterium]
MAEDKLDFKQLGFKALKYWCFYLLSFPLTLAGGYFYLKTTHPKFQVEAQLLIKDEENSGQMSEEILFSELGLGKKKKNLENEVLVLRSSPLMKEVVQNNELQYRYFTINGIVKRELYKIRPSGSSTGSRYIRTEACRESSCPMAKAATQLKSRKLNTPANLVAS